MVEGRYVSWSLLVKDMLNTGEPQPSAPAPIAAPEHHVQVGNCESFIGPDGRRAGKILVVRGGAIGDFILTLPVLAALRAQLPQARLEVLGYPHIAQLALAGGLADDVRAIEARPLAGFFARAGELAPELQEYFAGFAIVISYLYDPDAIFQANVARCSKAQFLAGPHRPDEGAGLHATEVFLKPLERLAIFDADPAPKLPLRAAHDTPHATRLQLALHPGSGSERKNWPEAKWAELLAQLTRTTDVDLLLIGGAAEGTRLERLAGRLPSERVRLASQLPLTDLAGLLTGCMGFVGHDSGITHLAAALDLPGLVLWGDTAQAIWRPRSERMRILAAASGGLGALPIESVLREVQAMLARRQGREDASCR
jgi:heptosyltransferase-2